MNKTFIIAEAGVNHNGSLEIAKQMVQAAVAFGADAIKFQTFRTEKIVSPLAPKTDYQRKTTPKNESHFDMIKKLELNEAKHRKLIQFCKQSKILFLSSPFDLESVRLLNALGLNIFKIPSGEITNFPYLQKIGALKKEVIVSTGMSNMEEIEQSLDVLIKAGTPKDKITLLHCNTEYPTPLEDVNLNAMLTLRSKFGVRVGYSDHTPGIEVSIAAVAMGAEVIEKHFTLDQTMSGPDHKASLSLDEFGAMVCAIRNIEKALGTGIKNASPSELRNKEILRKSIVAERDISRGERFTTENIAAKRPAKGISPMKWNLVINQVAIRDFKADEAIEI